MTMLKAIKFLEKLYIDIEILLLVTFLVFQYFLFIKDDTYKILFVLLTKTKEKIYEKLVDF